MGITKLPLRTFRTDNIQINLRESTSKILTHYAETITGCGKYLEK
jgi:hypothetical protein